MTQDLHIPQPFFSMLREMTNDDFNQLINCLMDYTENGTEPDTSSPVYMSFHVWKMLLGSN